MRDVSAFVAISMEMRGLNCRNSSIAKNVSNESFNTYKEQKQKELFNKGNQRRNNYTATYHDSNLNVIKEQC